MSESQILDPFEPGVSDEEFLSRVRAVQADRLARFTAWKGASDPHCFNGPIARVLSPPVPLGQAPEGQTTIHRTIRLQSGSLLLPGDGSVREVALPLAPSGYFNWRSQALELDANGMPYIDRGYAYGQRIVAELARRGLQKRLWDLCVHQIAVMVFPWRKNPDGIEILTHVRGKMQTSDYAGRLSAHGGLVHVEHGFVEDPYCTGVRELEEETGIRYSLSAVVGTTMAASYLPEDMAMTLGYLIEITSGEEPTLETDEGRSFWTPLSWLMPALRHRPDYSFLRGHLQHAGIKTDDSFGLATDFADLLRQLAFNF